MNPDPLDTIVAPATPVGRSALAIVRIDGPEARSIIEQLGAENLVDRVATLSHLRDDRGDIDEAIVIRYQKPHSFTGNDLVEVTLHGSPVIIDRLIRAVVDRGARTAEAGEFTERAVLNGKVDLVQAEAIGDLIASRTALQAKLSLANLDGELSRAANVIRAALLDVISKLEGALDFSDEGYEFIGRDEALTIVRRAIAQVKSLGETYRRGRSISEGLTLVILGRPNAGKSTLLNFLCGTERAIVTPIPGTTRDLLREVIEIGGLPVTLVDTAGVRESSDVVEQIGIRRARDAATSADLVLYLIDAAEGFTAEDRAELSGLANAMTVFTKTDVADAPAGEISLSVKEQRGVEALLAELDRLVQERFAPPEGSPLIVNERQRAAIEECDEALRTAAQGLQTGMQNEVILVDLYRAAGALGLLTGAISNAEVLQTIFSKFCIGK